jgi:hypothetical protein
MKQFAALTYILATTLCAGAALAATSTPAPGGANQVNAVEGAVGATLFNGEVRIKGGAVRDATSDEIAGILPAADKKVIVYTATMSNGTKSAFTGMLGYALVDADGVSISAEDRYVTPNPPPNVPPGAAWHQKVAFLVPKDFTPKKLVITVPLKSDKNDTAKAFRLILP